MRLVIFLLFSAESPIVSTFFVYLRDINSVFQQLLKWIWPEEVNSYRSILFSCLQKLWFAVITFWIPLFPLFPKNSRSGRIVVSFFFLCPILCLIFLRKTRKNWSQISRSRFLFWRKLFAKWFLIKQFENWLVLMLSIRSMTLRASPELFFAIFHISKVSI